MFKNYIITAFRNLWKNKTSTFINALGLTIGLSCCLLIGLYIQHELSYDKFQQKGDRTVRMIMEYSFSGEATSKGNYTSTKVAPVFVRTFPEVESAVRMYQYSRVVQYGDKMIDEENFMFADSSFFDVFSFNLLQGSKEQALSGPRKLLLTASTAIKYFGNESPVGKILKIGADAEPYEVTGIVADCPTNSQIKFDFLASFSSLGVNQEETYWNANYTTFLLLKDKASIASLQKKIEPFMKKEMEGQNAHVSFLLEPFNSIHLHSKYGGFEPNNNITYIYIVAAIAFLILAIACFTYINLSTARSVERAREVGIRKVVGAMKGQIFRQFMGESVLLSLGALLLSLVVVGLVLPGFNQLTEKQLVMASLLNPMVTGITVVTLACISLLAGSYPALVLSGFQPVKVLKGAFKNTGSGLLLRKSLIVFQFMISVFLVVATFIIQSQLHYIQNKNMGFNREHVLVLPSDNKINDRIQTLKTVFKSNPQVQSVSRAVNAPTDIHGGYVMNRPGMAEGEYKLVTACPVDEEYIKTTGLQIMTGSDFTLQDIKDVQQEDRKNNVYHFLLNELAVKELGWKTPEEAIGQRMSLGDDRAGYVKGVLKDFHFLSLHEPLKPLVLFVEDRSNIVLVKITGKDIPNTLASLEKSWKQVVPHRPFDYHFLDEDFNRLYSAEMRIGKVLSIFASIAIALACLGLFGLSSYVVQQRMKEVSIRKVLGASSPHIIATLSKDFIKLAALATVIAFPVGWWAANQWLLGFTYQVQIHWWVFVLAALLSIVIALVTVSIRAIKAALSNPVKSLRSE